MDPRKVLFFAGLVVGGIILPSYGISVIYWLWLIENTVWGVTGFYPPPPGENPVIMIGLLLTIACICLYFGRSRPEAEED